MTTQAKLTDTQTTVLNTAVGRPDGNIEPLPANLRGGARTKVVDGLLARGLVVDSDGHYLLTDSGYAAVGKHRPVPKGVQKADAPDDFQKLKGTRTAGIPASNIAVRSGTKLATVIDCLRQPDGATIDQLMTLTNWQAHTVRGAISGMVRKHLGYEVVTEKGTAGERVYRIA